MADRSTILAIPSIREAFDAFLALSPQEFGILIGLVLWVGLLAFPLTRIDRRDRITHASYTAFMAFAGSCLILGATRYLAHGQQAAPAALLVCAFAVIAALRWLVDRAAAKERNNKGTTP